MGLIFKLFLAYENRFGTTPKLIKSLRASGDPKNIQAAQSIQADLDERTRNPPKNMQEFVERALNTSRQVERGMRVDGRHADAEELSKVIDHTEKSFASKKNRKRT